MKVIHANQHKINLKRGSILPLLPLSKPWLIIPNTGPAVFWVSPPQLDISPRCFSAKSEENTANPPASFFRESLTFKTLGCIKRIKLERWGKKTTVRAAHYSQRHSKFERQTELLTARREWPARRGEPERWCRSGGPSEAFKSSPTLNVSHQMTQTYAAAKLKQWWANSLNNLKSDLNFASW